MKKGKFIVLEGGEGAGKTSCINFLKEALVYRNDFTFTREPGGTSVGEKVRTILLQEEMDIKTELFLFCGIRVEVLDKIIKPTINSGRHVICDRFYPSTRTYQVHKNKLEHQYLETFKRLNEITIGDCIPDAIIYLDVTPEIGLERREKSNEGICTKFDKAKIEDHYRIRNGYLMQYEETIRDKINNPEWHLILTDNMTEQEVQNAVLTIVQKLIAQ